MAERIGEFLIRIKAITQAQMDEVLKIQAGEEEPRLIGEIAIERGYINDDAVKRYLAERQ
jgi:hypothetical protein